MADEPEDTSQVDEPQDGSGDAETSTSPAQRENEPADRERSNAEWADLRKAKKEAEDLRKRLKEFEDKDKSESDRLRESHAAAERRATEAETQLLRLQVAADKGLTPAQAKRLVGESREDLEADADELLDTFAAKGEDKAAASSNGRPRERLRPGTVPDADKSTDMAAVADQIRSGGA